MVALLLCCSRDFWGIFLSVVVLAHCFQIIWQSIAHERIVFQKVFFLFFAINNFQTIGGRVPFLLPGLHKEGKSLTCSYLLLPTDPLHPTASQWQTSLDCWSPPIPYPRRCCGWGVSWHSPSMILDEILLPCTVPAWGQFIRQGRSRCMLGEAGNSDDRQSLFHLPWLLANDVLFISRSAKKTLRHWLPSETCSITSSFWDL